MLCYRPHRGSLESAVKEMKEFATFSALLKHLHKTLDPVGIEVDDSKVKIVPYAGADKRIGWPDTWLVMVGMHPVGFITNKELAAVNNNSRASRPAVKARARLRSRR